MGVWRVELPAWTTMDERSRSMTVSPQETMVARVRHTKRGYAEKEITLEEFFKRYEQYFTHPQRVSNHTHRICGAWRSGTSKCRVLRRYPCSPLHESHRLG
jgi:hypothetical protein